jgi:hypothetical protein
MGQAIRLDCVGEGGYDFCLVGDVGERFWAVLFHPGGGGGGGRGGHGQSLPEQIIMVVAPAARLKHSAAASQTRLPGPLFLKYLVLSLVDIPHKSVVQIPTVLLITFSHTFF